MKILDFSRLLPAPLATQMLAELGAEVWKVERPQSLDSTRFYAPRWGEESQLFHVLNKSKTIVLADFTTDAGREILRPYIEQADILIEQFRPNVMQVWGLDYAQIKLINPNIIYISVTGFGQTGDLAAEAGHDLNFLALSGLLDLLRDENGKPVMPNFQIADVAGGAWPVVVAAQAAYIARQKTGEGRYIDVAMSACLSPLMSITLAESFSDTKKLSHAKNELSGGLVNYNIYQCKDGRWLAFAPLELKFWRNFCCAAAREDWHRENLADLSVLKFDKNELVQFFVSQPQAYWAAWAIGKDICLSPIIELADWAESPMATEFELIETDENNRKSLRFLPFWAR
jgi:crotonobetainyl-CoA:carnitine CoA-transferase CaiB-like acyl-CoA transferase